MQTSLFEADEPTPVECRYPMLAGTSGYRAGCRCERCRTDKNRHGYLEPICQHDGCTAYREKGRRFCAEHGYPVRVGARSKQVMAPCEICNRSHTWYESMLVVQREDLRDLYRRTCSGCRSGYMGSIRAHHLDSEWAFRLITADRCELCDKPFSTTTTGRYNSHVDHDHKCCPSGSSCGACVGGIVCPRCNHAIAMAEAIIEISLVDVLTYLQRARGRGAFLSPSDPDSPDVV